MDAALMHFQKQHSSIPKLEYKRGDDSATCWYFAQTALVISKGQSYPAGPPGRSLD